MDIKTDQITDLLKKQLEKKEECKRQYDNSEEMSFDKEKNLTECLNNPN